MKILQKQRKNNSGKNTNINCVLLLGLAMAFTTEEVLAFLEADDGCEVDDQQELFMEGSNEEFDDLDEEEDGIHTFLYLNLALYIVEVEFRESAESHDLHPHPQVSSTYKLNMPHDIGHSPHIESAMLPEIDEHSVSRRTREKPEV